MTLTKAALAERARQRQMQRQQSASGENSRNSELALLVLGMLAISAGLWLVYHAKTVAAEQTVNLNEVSGPQQLIPVLQATPDAEFIADRIFELRRRDVRFGNDGAIARLRVKESELKSMPGLAATKERMAEARTRREEREEAAHPSWWEKLRGARVERELSIPLLTSQQYSALKPFLVVRTRLDFRLRFLLWTALFFFSFAAVHFFWRVRGFTGDTSLLPIVFVLCGIGLVMMLSLRDPLRDTLMFTDFIQGVAVGCLGLVAFSALDYEQLFGRLSYVPLLGAFVLAIALGFFGSGPGGSDAKVNLFFFQPVELIRILLVLFLSGYFARNWDALRQLRQQPGPWNIPRLDYVLPVALGVLLSIGLFFWLSDLGPALVLGCLFLTLYSIARKHVVLAGAGLLAIVLAFAIGYAIHYPHAVTERVDMWKSPWDNPVRGGDQVADSLWALSTGGATGTGLGLGDPALMPAAHTDLILSAIGEELGFCGIGAVLLLYALLIRRCLQIALQARGVYSYFLVVGLALILALQTLLIAGGLLGLIPLSGVVSPFLSYGRTSMVANFLVLAAVLAVSSRPRGATVAANFTIPTRALSWGLAVLAFAILGRAAYVQVARADSLVVRGALVPQADGVRRYQYNPRILAVARQLPKGTIYDRNGLPLATSDYSLIDKHRADYEKLGVALDHAASKLERRHYPMGAPLFYLLGDARSRWKQGAGNTAFQEKASRVRLQGYDDVAQMEDGHVRRDYRELIPLLRHRYQPDNPAVQALLERPRDVRMAIDARLQLRVSAILEQRLQKLGKQKAAAVVLDPSTGEMLAAVSYPLPSQAQFASLSTNPQAPLPDPDLIDRARFGLYPPGSAFKIVTAMAALRKDPGLSQQHFDCLRLPDGRNGNYVGNRAIRDDIQDTVPHGSVDMAKGITISCNAYFAQLGAEKVGAQSLYETATLLGISVARPNTIKQLEQYLAQASYGQGQVVVSPFQMARVAATIAQGGQAPQGRWLVDETNTRVRVPETILPSNLAQEIGRYMRAVVTSGTGRALNGSAIAIAGKTGTAELAHAASHAWFIGYAPFGAKNGKQIAFAVLVENGQYGGTASAPIAGDIVAAAHELGII